MLNWLKERQHRSRTARALYGSIVAEARHVAFYTAWGIPDTAQGRFEVLTLHVAAVMRRLQSEGPEGQQAARALGEVFVTDMDDSMREMTFSDLAVPREVKRIAAALYDRHAALGETDLAALGRTLEQQLQYLRSGTDTAAIDTMALAGYFQRVLARLATQSRDSLFAGDLEWPSPISAAGDPR